MLIWQRSADQFPVTGSEVALLHRLMVARQRVDSVEDEAGRNYSAAKNWWLLAAL
jgi:hypothetical protein